MGQPIVLPAIAGTNRAITLLDSARIATIQTPGCLLTLIMTPMGQPIVFLAIAGMPRIIIMICNAPSATPQMPGCQQATITTALLNAINATNQDRKREISIKPIQILLTNDDGIQSPGLFATARALAEIGFVQVVAPRDQSSGAGRSLPVTSDGKIQINQVQVNDQPWDVYAVGGTPAQAVLHAILEILPARPNLIVSGVNYGENVGNGITISGTIGAALEGASLGIPSLAVSLETDPKHHYSLSETVDFTAAAYFTTYFSRQMLSKQFPADVDVLKIDIPCDATPDTGWVVTRVSPNRYFEPLKPQRTSWDIPGIVGYRANGDYSQEEAGTDVYALHIQRLVSVTPLSLDMTSRVNLKEFEGLLRAA